MNETRPVDYWNYKDFEISWGCSLEDYEVGEKLGSGKVLATFGFCEHTDLFLLVQ